MASKNKVENLKTAGFAVKDLPGLNWYQLQKAIYEGHALYDKPATHEQGRALIEACFAEYARRGVSKVAKPDLK
jgi:hypothetical protein